ncbi:MAG: NIPSNAP family protein [Paenibacillaceae bacterium]
MLYELRIYHMHPGKMKAIHDRFSGATLQLFTKHRLRVVDFWEDIDPEHNRLYYVMEHASMEARDLGFEDFVNDPEWQRVKETSEADGPIVEKVESIFLKRAPYFTKSSL